MLPVAAVVLVLAIAGAAGLWQQYQTFLNTPLDVDESGMLLNVESGSNLRTVLTQLESRGVTRFDWRWRLFGRLQKETIKTGEYTLTSGMLPGRLLKLLASGKVVNYRFTIVEGWTVKQLLAEMNKDPVLQQEDDGEFENCHSITPMSHRS